MHVRRRCLGICGAVLISLASLSPVAAQTPGPTPTATLPELIGAGDTVSTGLEWFQRFGLFGALGVVLLGAALFVLYGFARKTGEGLADFLYRIFLGRRFDQRVKDLDARDQVRQAQREQAKTQPTGLAAYLAWLQTEYGATQPLGIAEPIYLRLEAVHVPLRVVERDVIERYRQRMRGEQPAAIDPFADEPTIGHVFALLSEPELLAPPARRGKPRQLPPQDDLPPPLTTRRLLLLGDAGSGKTMSLRYAALRLAEAYRKRDPALLADPEVGLHLHLRRPPLPIYVRLTLFAASLPTDLREIADVQARQPYVGASPDLFLTWLDQEAPKYCAIQSGLLSALIRQNDGGVILLLDGLDEAGNDQQRAYLAALISNLAQRYDQQRYVVSSRTAGYRGRIFLEDFIERHLSPLNAEEVQTLLQRWYGAVHTRLAELGRRRQEVATEQADQLWAALEQNERLFEMATNPLLLTVMALLQFNSIKLPDQRARLYEKLVELLLDNWRKQNVSNETLVMSVSQLANEQRRLAALALAMQQQPQQVREVSLSQAQAWLRPLYVADLGLTPGAADERVRDLLHRLTVDSGILQSRDERYAFSHYTFQEYLAAWALDSLDDREDRQAEATDSVTFLLAHSAEARWRETLLLAAGLWSNSPSVIKTRRLVRGLLAQEAPAQLLLAGAVFGDIGMVEDLTSLRSETLTRLHVCAALSDAWPSAGHPDPVMRNQAASLLDRLEADEERLGLDLAADDYWAEQIKPGTFSMGDNNGKWDDEKPQFDYTLSQPYALARFPVTNRQYLRFTEALDGRGTPEAVQAAKQLLDLMQKHKQTAEEFRPRYWPGARYRAGTGNHPVVGVSWYAATAFAWWVDAWLRELGLLSATELVRLPSEAEWERAAAYPLRLPGGDPRAGRREYPWGDKLTDQIQPRITESIQANIDASKIGGTSVVGIFPHGAADCGAQDMAGNVWEWCSTPPLKYPFMQPPAAEILYTENKNSNSSFVLRGGAWNLDPAYARAACRFVNHPTLDVDDYGFRLARLFSLP